MRGKRAALQDRTDPVEIGCRADDDGSMPIGDAVEVMDATTRPDLEAQLERLRADRDQVLQRAAVARARLADDDWFLDAADEAIDAEDKIVAKADRRAQRLEAIEARILEQLDVLAEREAEAARLERYQAAAEKAAEAAAWIAGEYATASAAIGAGLARLGEIDDELKAVNADRPDGAPVLELEGFRVLPATAATVEFVSERYYANAEGQEVRPSTGAPLSQDRSGQFYVDGQPVFARERQVPVRTPGRAAVAPRELVEAVRLPGVLYADPDFWPRRSKLWGA